MRREQFQIGSYISPNEAFHYARKTLAPGPPKLAHWHDYYELFLVADGEARHLVNGFRETLGPGSIVFMRPDDLHAVWSDPKRDCTIMNVMFHRSTAEHLIARYPNELAGRFFWSEERRPFSSFLTGPTLERVRERITALDGGGRGLMRIEGCLADVMAQADTAVGPLASTMPIWLADACAHARRPDAFTEGAAGLVRAAGRGHEHVCRAMRRHLGQTPTQYVNAIRLAHAARRLARDATPLEDVARESGFESMSHFHRLFRNQYGSPPATYRRRCQRDPLSIH